MIILERMILFALKMIISGIELKRMLILLSKMRKLWKTQSTLLCRPSFFWKPFKPKPYKILSVVDIKSVDLDK